MLGFGIPAWVYALCIGSFLGYWVSRYNTVKYCTECQHYGSEKVEYCPVCGKSTEERELKKIHTLTPLSDFISEHSDWDYLERPRQELPQKAGDYNTVGTYTLKDRGESYCPDNPHSAQQRLRESQYILRLDDQLFKFNVVEEMSNGLCVKKYKIEGMINKRIVDNLEEEGDSK